MRMIVFAIRNQKEIVRDRLNLAFGLGFPLVLLVLLSAIQSNVPVPLFEIEQLAPGLAVFGLSFISLFSGMLIAKDRTSSFLMRLFSSPLSAKDFIYGYTLPMLPMAVAQVAITFLASIFFGLTINIHTLMTIVVLIPAAALFIAIGLLAGSLFTDKQVGGVCGALLTNLSAWLSGVWFDLNLVGGVFQSIAEALPFFHAVNAARATLAGDYGNIFPSLYWVLGYAIVFLILAIAVFRRKMQSEQ